MARRPPDDDDGRKKSAREDQAKAEEQELEQQQERERAQDQQQTRDSAQDALGNEAVQAMMGVSNTKAGEAGQGADLAERHENEQVGVDYGGDDAPADAPITMEDLVRSWNPTTQRGSDKEPFRDGIDTEDLADPDPSLLGDLGTVPPLTRRPALFLSAPAAEVDPGPVITTLARLAGDTVLARVIAAFVAPIRTPLVDRRVVVARTRALALAVLAAEAAIEVAPAADRAELRTFFRFAAELASRRKVTSELLDHVATEKIQLPTAAALAERGFALASTSAPSGRSPSVEQIEHLKAAFSHVVPRTTATALVPELPNPGGAAALPAPEDDPLGLDSLLAQGFTPDPVGAQYDQLLGAAEKLAVATTRARVDAAAAAIAVADVLGASLCGPLARRAVTEFDAEGARTLQLLVEIARAIQQRAVPPAGVRNGLRRAAKAIDVSWTQLCAWLSGVVADAVPPPVALALPPLPVDDALQRALAEGDLVAARRAIPADSIPDLVVARAILDASNPNVTDADEQMHRAATLARAAGRPALARLADLWAALTPRRDRGRALGQALRVQQEAFAAGDDLSFAAVTQSLLDTAAATRPDRVRTQHLEACRRILPLGPTAGLALLTRWAEDAGRLDT